MRLFSFAISLLLHFALLGLAVYMANASPAPFPGRLVYTVDLLAPGPLATPEADPGDAVAQAPAGPIAPEPPKIDPIPEPPNVDPIPVPEPSKPEPVIIPEPQKPEPPKPEPAVVPEPPKPEPVNPAPPKPVPPKPVPPKPAPPKPAPAKPAPQKPEPPKPRPPSAEDIVRNALADAQRASVAQSPSDPVAGALESLRNPQVPRGTPAGVPGEGGTGAGGTAGIESVYIAQIIAAVRPNWKSVPQARRQDLRVVVRIDLSPSGDVLCSRIVSTSGDARVDSSALDAIAATGTLPPPPNAGMRSLDVTFRLSDMDSGRG